MTTPAYMRIRPWQHLLYLVLLAFGCAILGVLISLVVIRVIYGSAMVMPVITMTDNGDPHFLGAFRIFLGLGNTLFTFFVSAVVFAQFISGEPQRYLRTRTYVPPVLFLVTVAIMVFMLPVIDITAYFNQKMTLPAGLQGLEKWIRDAEKQNEAVVKMVLDMKNTGDLLLSVFIVGILPALSEEFFFRGCMQTIFMRWTKNVHATVWITAFIFSFIHFEFLGFVPRFLLGAALGYVFAWSGSIWPSVLLHCLNNSTSVVGYYLYQRKLIVADPDSNTPMFSQMWVYVVCAIAAVGVMLLFRKITIDKHLATDNGEELDQADHID